LFSRGESDSTLFMLIRLMDDARPSGRRRVRSWICRAPEEKTRAERVRGETPG
jgi:hypothetical protein